MPLVLVTANRNHPKINDAMLNGLCLVLREQIPRFLACDDPGGHLTPDDIEIQLRDRDPSRDVGASKHDLHIVVLANDFPSRKANLDERCKHICGCIAECYKKDNIHGFVWIRLAPASFQEF